MTNAEIARVFDEIGDLLEIQGANSFRVRAYRNASRTLEGLSEPVSDLASEGVPALTELPGIGKDIASKIVDLLQTGSIPQLEELRDQVPPGVVQMLRIPGIGPKKVGAIFSELNVTTLEDLKAAAETGQIAEMKGFGKKTAQTILEGLEQIAAAGNRFYLAEVKPAAEEIVTDLKSLKSVTEAELAGSARRRKETCGDLDLLVTSTDSKAVMDRLASHDHVEKVLARGDTKQRVRLKIGIELDLRVVPEESYGAAMQYFTGSKEHNIAIRQRAQKRGLKLNEYGLYRDDELVASQTESAIYKAVDLPWIPPELRENRGEIEAAEEGTVPDLIEVQHIKADLHMHTTATDGTASIREMAEAAKARGLKYIAITDHSKRVTMANGLDSDRLRKHWEEIRTVAESLSGIKVLCGIECDILEDAELDLPDDVLSEADWVIAVLHYGLKQPREQIMKRLLNAVRNPNVCAIGHPSGRIIGRRPGADINYTDLFKAAADEGVMMEINSHPSRLDLNEIQAASAKDYGIPIVINTDAHSTSGFDVLEYGVYQARRAGLEKKDVANTLPLSKFRRLLRTSS
ncbi:DNA polymerase/3'-5' exonuclease PolX [Thalassoglobus neptunius]|uniref:DNA polymerase beta n=1 Tax=Thalassoglobus neptunius TaxID=1938619 RepID=A0A5C5X477_9PLAN|nr:DNA polymerase/3'-5' exonuclease PolX [Thalassoglobus neptunius]TWT57131.1 DNA polymerase/3'-5' exonuclease PolX [Thalassoglobus neptunius]